MFHVVWESNHLSRRLSLLTLLDFGPPSERTVLFDLCVIPPSQTAPINMVTQGMTGCNQIAYCSYNPLALLVGWVSELKKVKGKKKKLRKYSQVGNGMLLFQKLLAVWGSNLD